MTASNALFEENHDIFRESVRRFIQKHVTPYHEEWEKEGVVPRDFWLEAGAAGILCPDLPSPMTINFPLHSRHNSQASTKA